MTFSENCLTTSDEIEKFKDFDAARSLSVLIDKETDALEGLRPRDPFVCHLWTIQVVSAASLATLPVDDEIFLPPTKSPFDVLDERKSDDEKAKEIIAHLRELVATAFADQLAARLEELYALAKEEEPDEIAILPGSLRNFLSFLSAAGYLRSPDVVLSPQKNLRVQWHAGWNRHFVAEFLWDEENVQFVVFAPDPTDPEAVARVSGTTRTDSLMKVVEPLGVLNWASNER